MPWGTSIIPGSKPPELKANVGGRSSPSDGVVTSPKIPRAHSKFLSDTVLTTPQVPFKLSLLWQTSPNPTQPTRVAQATSVSTKLVKYSRLIKSPQGSYTLTLEMPKTLFTNDERVRLCDTIELLNSFADIPIQTFRWDGNYSGGRYDRKKRVILLGRSPRSSKVNFLDDTLSTVVHLMGKAIYRNKSTADQQDWNLIFDLSLEARNFEILEPSNYLKIPPQLVNSQFYLFTTFDLAIFDSSVYAYFLHADKLMDLINDSNTPDAKASWGILVWCFLRERVFQGRVFTSDGKDPFQDEKLESLLKSMGKRRLEAIISGLADKNRDIRFKAALALYGMGPSAKDALPALMTALKDKDLWVRIAVINVIGEIGQDAESAIPTLTALYKKEKELRLRRRVVEALSNMGPKANPVLIIALEDEDPFIREDALEGLLENGVKDKGTIPVLEGLINKDKDPGRRQLAVLILSKMGPRGIPGLLLALKDKDAVVSNEALHALQLSGRKEVPQLIKGLKDKDPDVRREVVIILGNMGKASKAARPALRRVLRKDKDSGIRAHAAVSLSEIDPNSKALPRALIRAVKKDLSDHVQQTAARLLGEIRPVTKGTVRALTYAVERHLDPRVREVAAETLGEMGFAARAAIPVLERVAGMDENIDVQEAAEKAIRKIDSPN